MDAIMIGGASFVSLLILFVGIHAIMVIRGAAQAKETAKWIAERDWLVTDSLEIFDKKGSFFGLTIELRTHDRKDTTEIVFSPVHPSIERLRSLKVNDSARFKYLEQALFRVSYDCQICDYIEVAC